MPGKASLEGGMLEAQAPLCAEWLLTDKTPCSFFYLALPFYASIYTRPSADSGKTRAVNLCVRMR